MDLTLSNRGDYVVRSAICLARAYGSGQPRKLRQVSAEMEVPRTFVSQILGDLVRADLAVSSFGKDGGYRLARPPGLVSLLQVIEAGEGSLVPEACPPAAQPCHWREICPVYDSWAAAAGALRAVLASTSLASVLERDRVLDDGTSPTPADRATVRSFLRGIARCLEDASSGAGGLAEDGDGERRVGAEGA